MRLSRLSWWRAGRYEITGGYIRPAPGTDIRAYDVKTESQFELYAELLEIARDSEGEDLRALSPAFASRITNWCSKHGLLGVLLQQVTAVSFGRRRYRLSDDARRTAALMNVADREWFTAERRYHRVQGHWRETCWFQPGQYSPRDERQYRGLLEDGEAIDAGPSESSGLSGIGGGLFVVGSNLNEPSFWLVGVGEAWHEFFPEVPVQERETYAYPPPLSEKFWRLYAEPVSTFLYAAQLLQNVIKSWKIDIPSVKLRAKKRGVRPLLEMMVERELMFRANATLDVWLDSCAPQGRGSSALVAPSLLGLFGLMAYEQLQSGRHPRECPTCKTLFVPDKSPLQEYCYQTCKSTARKRRQREQDKARKASARARSKNQRIR